MPTIPNPTSGIGVAAQVTVDSLAPALSLSGVNTHQIVATVKDSAGTIQSGTALVLSAVAAASGGQTVYTGTITGGGANAFAGFTFLVAGFVTGANNGTFECSASSTTTLTLANAAGAVETHAGTATPEDGSPFAFVSRDSNVATVSANGLLTGVIKGLAIVEVSAPTFNNAEGKANDGSYADKVYAEIAVQVGP